MKIPRDTPGAPLPEVVPVFPLPEVVLFPEAILPLHVFEPRYRALAKEAVAGDGWIVIALLQPGWELDYEGRPPVHDVACAGRIVHSQELPDGRWYLTLKGVVRVRLLEELDGGAYRRARVVAAPEDEAALRAPEAGLLLKQLLVDFAALNEEVSVVTKGVDVVSDPDVRIPVLHAVALHLGTPPEVRQSLLEIDDLRARLERMAALVQRALLERTIVAAHEHLRPEDPTVN
jgi:Lon protease-like protein